MIGRSADAVIRKTLIKTTTLLSRLGLVMRRKGRREIDLVISLPVLHG
jgi:hypothetical protein